MLAAKEATEAGIMVPVFTGERDLIEEEASKLNWDITAFDIIEADGEESAGLAAAHACGTGAADVIMKGHLHTDVFMKSVLNRDAGLRTGNRLVHIFHMSHPDGGKPLLISDAAVNVNPDLKTRQAAIMSVVEMLHKLGNAHPNVALLSATESAIPSVPSSMEAAELAEWAKSEIKGATVAGPLALDLILSSEAAATKGFENPVAGNADAVIVPDIVSGNTLFKALVYAKGACAAGVVMGAKVPVLLTSRADPASARLASAALAAILHNG
jgi:phosphate acetyltransferase